MPSSIAITDLVRYKLDLSGVSVDNLISDEVRVLENIGTKRAIVPKYGPFYTQSLVVYNDLTGNPLIEKVDYIAAQLNAQATSRSGKEICGILIFLNTNLSRVRFSYQCVGGPYMLTVDAMVDMISNLNLDDRPVYWGQILGKPTLFPPGHHLHDAGDVFGFEYLVLMLEEMRKAILLGDTASHQEIYDYINAAIANNTHYTDYNNPHQTTASQVGAYTVAEVNSLLTTINNLIGGHNSNTSNPHQTTAQQVGTYTTEQINTLLANSNNSLSSHILNTNNPHQTTAAQVGAYTVAEINTLLASINSTLSSHSHSMLVNGTAQATLSAAGYFTAPDIGIPSDERLKKNISGINDALKLIKELYGVWYVKKDTDVKSIGLIAQNVQAVVPEAVREDENGILSVLYPNLVGLLVNGIKELDFQVTKQNQIIIEHSNQLVRLQELVLSLEKRLNDN